MKISLLCMGKTDDSRLVNWMEYYEKRLPNFINFERIEIPDLKNTKALSQTQQIKEENKLFEKHIEPTDFIILLDENGKEFNSNQFSQFINKQMINGTKSLKFIIGGAYGFNHELKAKANQKLALSKMTFTHQMVRLFFTEQLYRAFTIIEGKPYHHN